MSNELSDTLVVDTNVAVVSNLQSDMSLNCAEKCIECINSVMSGKVIAVDAGWEIIGEYIGRLNQEGQPGVGDAFLKWVLTNLENSEKCVRVPISRCENEGEAEDYVEFPGSAALADFDPSDKKFAAVASAHIDKTDVIQASDSKWLVWSGGLLAAGVRVVFPCEPELRQIAQGKGLNI